MKEYRVTTRHGLFRVEVRLVGVPSNYFPWHQRTSNFATLEEANDELAHAEANDLDIDEPWLPVETTNAQ